MTKISKILILLVLGIFLFSGIGIIVNAEYVTWTCSCDCKEETISAKGYAKNADDAEERCQDMCGRACGARTECPKKEFSDCETCCEDWCSTIDTNIGKEGCKESCKNTCDFKKLVNGIIDLIFAAAGIVAAIMFVVHGFRLVSSQSPEDRDEAKKAIFFVIFALVVIGIGGVIVKEFAKRITIPEAEFEVIEGCGKDLHIDYEFTDKRMKFTVWVFNDGNTECWYKIIMKDYKCEEILFDSNPKNAPPGNPTKGKWIESRYTERFKGGYCLELKQVTPTPSRLLEKRVKTFEEEGYVGYKCDGNIELRDDVDPNPEIVGEQTIKFWLKITNPSKLKCDYRAELRDAEDKPLPGAVRTGSISAGGKPWETTIRRDMADLKGKYRIVLLSDGEEVDSIPEEGFNELEEGYKCEGELAMDTSKPENPKIEDQEITFYLTVKNPSKIKCTYDLYLKDKGGNIEARREGKTISAGGSWDSGTWLRTDIGSLNGEYSIVLMSEGEEVAKIGPETLPEQYQCDQTHTFGEPQRKDSQVWIDVEYESTGDIDCKYSALLKDKFGNVIDKTGFKKKQSKYTFKKNIYRELLGGCKLVLAQGSVDNELPETEKEYSFISDKAETKLREIGESVIDCWENNKDSTIDVMCKPELEVSLERKEAITREMVKGYIESRQKDVNFWWAMGVPITSDVKGVCIKFARIVTGDYYGGQVQIYKKDDTRCKIT